MKNDADLERLVPVLDEAAQAWHALQVGRSLEYEWPWPERGGRRNA